MLKKITAMILALVLILSMFAGCGKKTLEDTGIKTFGDTDSRKPLRILVDLQNFGTGDETYYYAALAEFVRSLKGTAGLENVVIEYLPGYYDGLNGRRTDNSIRETANDRVRVEIMSGGGPDVFIMTYMTYAGMWGIDYDKSDVLFKYPEKAMENGVFLPLDEYMENNTRFTEWDKQTQAVLEAGRNRDGQQIIPLTYTMPLLCIPRTDFDYTPDRTLYWSDMLTDPELSPYARDLANCSISYKLMGEAEEQIGWTSYLSYTLGELADYENEELLFTEEELLQRVQEILALEETDTFKEIYGAEELEYIAAYLLSERHFNKPMTMIPLYSDDGGVTVTIRNYAAINRNTKRPEDAYAVIDLLMSKKMQKDSKFFTGLLYGGYGLPLHEELGTEESPYNFFNFYMTDANHQEFSGVRDQITNANYDGELVSLLNTMFSMCHQPEFCDMTVEEIVHEAYVDMQRRVRE